MILVVIVPASLAPSPATVDVSGASTLTGAVQLGGDLDVPGVATLYRYICWQQQ